MKSHTNCDRMFEDLVNLKNYYISLMMEEKTPLEAIGLISKISAMEMEEQGFTVLPKEKVS